MFITISELKHIIRENTTGLAGIDAGVQDLVYDIQNAGFTTSWSCQGGYGHQEPWPTVAVNDVGSRVSELENIASHYGKPYRVTKLSDGIAYVELFPIANVDVLKMIVTNCHSSFQNYLVEILGDDVFSNIRNDYDSLAIKRDYVKGRDYTIGHGTRKLAFGNVMEQGDVIFFPEELKKESPANYDALLKARS